MSDSHLSSHELASYLTADLDEGERRRMEAHLADCDECRDELVEVRKLAAAATPTAKRRFPVGIGVAAAAIGAVLLIPWRRLQEPTIGDVGVDTQRPAAEVGRESVEVVSPNPTIPAPAGDLALVWRADSAGSIYRVRVTDDDGDVVWSASVKDTTVIVPDTTFIRGGAGTYYLYVDAQRANGFSLSSGARRFEIRR